jgi:hypothetical protein
MNRQDTKDAKDAKKKIKIWRSWRLGGSTSCFFQAVSTRLSL